MGVVKTNASGGRILELEEQLSVLESLVDGFPCAMGYFGNGGNSARMQPNIRKLISGSSLTANLYGTDLNTLSPQFTQEVEVLFSKYKSGISGLHWYNPSELSIIGYYHNGFRAKTKKGKLNFIFTTDFNGILYYRYYELEESIDADMSNMIEDVNLKGITQPVLKSFDLYTDKILGISWKVPQGVTVNNAYQYVATILGFSL